jgi:hypothetical protein
MAALLVEFRHQGEWRQVGPALTPGMRAGSLSHNGPAGRQMYVFGCDGPYSLLLRSTAGLDTAQPTLIRVVSALEGFEEIARLTPEQPAFECWLKIDRMREPTRFRFRHDPTTDER